MITMQNAMDEIQHVSKVQTEEHRQRQEMLAGIMEAKGEQYGVISEESYVRDILPLLLSNDPVKNLEGKKYHALAARDPKNDLVLVDEFGKQTWRLPPLIGSLPQEREPLDSPVKNLHSRLLNAKFNDLRSGHYAQLNSEVTDTIAQVYGKGGEDPIMSLRDPTILIGWEHFITQHGFPSMFTKPERDKLEEAELLPHIPNLVYYHKGMTDEEMMASVNAFNNGSVIEDAVIVDEGRPEQKGEDVEAYYDEQEWDC